MKKSEEVNKIARQLLEGINFSIIDEIERQLAGAFLFGVLNGWAYERKVDPVELQGLIIKEFVASLNYTSKQAVEFCQMLIDNTAKADNQTVNIIIHRGIDAYYELTKNEISAVKNNFSEIVDGVKQIKNV